MSDEQKSQNSMADDIGNDIGKTVRGAKTAGSALKAAGKAAAGNVAGAVVDVLKDKGLRNAVIACLLVFSLIIVAFPLIIGASIIAVVEAIMRGWIENWDEAWTKQGVESAGNTLYLYTIGGINALIDAGIDTLSDGFNMLFNIVFPKNHLADNSNLGADRENEVTQQDYDNILYSLIDADALVGVDGALHQRLNMIKARVQERGNQIKTTALEQYKVEAIGAAFAAGSVEHRANPLLYCGVDMTTSNINVDTSAFELSDIQAIKILAAYSAQYDCALTSVDMWDLMDYCGWYDDSRTKLSTNLDLQNSIYFSNPKAITTTDIGAVINIGEDVYDFYQLPAPKIPYWSGSFVPQWYVEEVEQLRRNAKQLLAESGTMVDRVDFKNIMQTTALKAQGIPTPDCFENLRTYESYGLVDIIYTATNATLTVSRQSCDIATTEMYNNAMNDQFILAKEALKDGWEGAMGAQQATTKGGNIVKRTENNRNIFILKNASTEYAYYIISGVDWNAEPYYVLENGVDLIVEGLAANTTYTVYRKPIVANEPPAQPPDEDPQPTKPQLPPGKEEDFGPQAIALNAITEEEPIDQLLGKEKIDTFKTFLPTGHHETYTLGIEVNITFAARSIDDIAMNVIGLWKGDLSDTTTDAYGMEFLSGYEGSEILRKTWTDKYAPYEFNPAHPQNESPAVDDNLTQQAQSTEYEFSRMQGYQYETYQDIVVGLATMLGYDTTGLETPEHSYGESIVEMAQKEIAYYQANNLIGGERYWKICGDAEGVHYDPSQPWCVCFVNACAYLCGYIGPDKCLGNFDGGRWIYGCGTHYKYLTTNNEYAIGYKSPSDGYKPVPGDFVYYGESTSSPVYGHIGIVKEVTPDGKLITLEGNVTGNGGRICKECIWNIDYEIGSYAYSYQGRPNYVVAYAHPRYPSPYLENPTYLSVQGETSAWAQARYIGSNEQLIMLAGICRFRESQLPTVVEDLKNGYAQFYTDELGTAIESGDMSLFMNQWNMLTNSGKGENFTSAQKTIFVNRYLRPLADQVLNDTHFDWTATTVREEILWALATTTDQHDALAELLETIALLVQDNTSDAELLAFLQSEDFTTMLNNRKASLWGADAEFLQTSWINGIRDAIVIIANTQNTEGEGSAT